VKRYDPLKAPDPKEWLATDEGERIEMVRQYHRRAKVKVPNARIHAAIHVIVENQIAEGDALPARWKLDQLMAEGLDRHDAVHAIGCVFAEHLHDAMSDKVADESDPNAPYWAALEKLTAESWYREYG